MQLYRDNEKVAKGAGDFEERNAGEERQRIRGQPYAMRPPPARPMPQPMPQPPYAPQPMPRGNPDLYYYGGL